MFAWVFCSIYLSLLVGGVGTLVILGIARFFKDVPKVFLVTLPVLIIWGVPPAAKRVSRVLAHTRGLPTAKRLRKILREMHS